MHTVGSREWKRSLVDEALSHWKRYMWRTLSKSPPLPHQYQIWVRSNFICTGHFLAKLRSLHQCVTEGLALYHTKSWSPAWTHRQVSDLLEHGAMDNFVCVFKERNFKSLQSVYDCLSVYRHIINPRYHNCCLSLPFIPTIQAAFSQEHVNFM